MFTISCDTIITGDIRSPGPIQVSGRVKGDGTFEELLIVSSTCVWDGDIVADNIIIEGIVTGNIIGRKKIQIDSNAQVSGYITTPKLAIAEGAQIESVVNMRPMPKPIELNDKKNKKQAEQKKDEIEIKKEEQVKQLA